MGRKSFSQVFVFGIGQIHAIFQAAGKDCMFMQELMMFTSGGVKSSAPVELSVRRLQSS